MKTHKLAVCLRLRNQKLPHETTIQTEGHLKTLRTIYNTTGAAGLYKSYNENKMGNREGSYGRKMMLHESQNVLLYNTGKHDHQSNLSKIRHSENIQRYQREA